MSGHVLPSIVQSHFTYTPLNHEEQCIRVFRICQDCDSINLQLRHTQDLSQHIAISYRWSPPDTNRTIQVDGKPFEVCGNLFDLLVELHKKKMDYDFWVDAVCIDQAHTRERNHQVQQMHKIYEKAKMTFFWLGSGDTETNHALDFLEQIAAAHGGLSQELDGNFHKRFSSQAIKTSEICVAAMFKHHSIRKRMSHAFEQICTNECFGRTWIFQEIVLSVNRFLLIGSHMISWDMFWNLIEESYDNEGFADAVFSISGSKNMCFQSLCHFFVNNPSISLIKLMLATEESECSDIRDKVYALNGVLQNLGVWSPVVDYAKTSTDLLLEVLWEVDFSWNKNFSTIASGENGCIRECGASKFHRLCRMLSLSSTDVAIGSLTEYMSIAQLEQIKALRFRLKLERQSTQPIDWQHPDKIEIYTVSDLQDTSGAWYAELLVQRDGSCSLSDRYSDLQIPLNVKVDPFNHDYVIDVLLPWADMTTILKFTKARDGRFVIQERSLLNKANLRDDALRYRSVMMKNESSERPAIMRVDSEQLYRQLGI